MDSLQVPYLTRELSTAVYNKLSTHMQPRCGNSSILTKEKLFVRIICFRVLGFLLRRDYIHNVVKKTKIF